MKKVVEYYIEYGKEITMNRAFYNFYDGLKPVHRRIILASYKLSNNFEKSAKLVGLTLNYHPHGEQSLYGAIVFLANNGLFEKQGNWGFEYGMHDEPAAAMRYTELKRTEFLNEIGKYLKYVPEHIGELNINEKNYIPTPIPLCLMFTEPQICMGFGFQSRIPVYKFDDIKDFIIGKKNIISPYVEGNTSTGEIEKLFITGEGKIKFEPNIIVKKDGLIIKGLPVLKKISTILNSIDEINNHVLSIIDLSSNSTEILLKKNKRCNIEKIYDKIKSKLVSEIKFNVFVVKNDIVTKISIKDWILNVYDNFLKIYKEDIMEKINEIENKIEEINIIRKIRKYIPKLYDNSQYIDILSKKINIESSRLEKILKNKTIHNLINNKESIDKLNIDLNKYQKKLKRYKYYFKKKLLPICNIDEKK